MTKELKTAAELSEIILRIAGIHGMDVVVRPDHVEGWAPTVFVATGSPIGAQRSVEEIARKLRAEYDLAVNGKAGSNLDAETAVPARGKRRLNPVA
jgi:hypothetical protein